MVTGWFSWSIIPFRDRIWIGLPSCFHTVFHTMWIGKYLERANASAKVQIDYRLRYAHTRSSKQASRGLLRDVQPLVICSRFIEMCEWAYGTIYVPSG